MPNGHDPKINFVVFDDPSLPMGEVWRQIIGAEPEGATHLVVPLDNDELAIVSMDELHTRIMNLTLNFFKGRYKSTTFRPDLIVASNDPDKDAIIENEWAAHPGAIVIEVDAQGEIIGFHKEPELGDANDGGMPLLSMPRTLHCPVEGDSFPLSQCSYDSSIARYRCPNGHRLMGSVQ